MDCDIKNILVVDDEPDLCELLKEELEFEGFTVKTAENGRHALEVLAGFPAELIVTDINMPEMDGVALLEKVGEMEMPRPQVIACTGFRNYERERLIDLGAAAVLYKPFNFDDLSKLIKRLSGRVEP